MAVFDFAYIGFGASAKVHLLNHWEIFQNKSLLIIDPQPKKSSHHFFCSFSAEGILEQEEYTWNKFHFRSPTVDKTFDTSVAYRGLMSDQIQKACFDKLKDRLPETQLIEKKAERLELKDKNFLIDTSAETYLAKKVFDSRSISLDEPHWKQHFLGQYVEFEKPHELEDPILMDVHTYSQGLKFFYTLPVDPHTLLVEVTYYSAQELLPETYREQIRQYLDRRFSDRYQVRTEESGSLRLITITNKIKRKNYQALGIRAGHMRASTGYSLFRSAREPRNHFLWKLTCWMDRIFLRSLQQNPEKSSEVFEVFFRRLEGDTIADFMGPEPSLKSLLKVVLVMPKLRFIWALFHETFYPKNHYSIRTFEK